MNMRTMPSVAAGLALLAAAPMAQAAGFGIYEQGARALGTAGAFTARADDPSSIYFNPAGLAHLDGKSLLVSPNLLYYASEFAGVDPAPGFGVTEETEGQFFPPFSLYYGHGIDSKFAAGIGIYTPYGLQVEWEDPDTYTGRTISTFSRITPFYFVPTVAWSPTPSFRIGAGAQLVLSTVELRRHLQAYNPLDDVTEDIGTVALESDNGFGAGFNAGVQWWPADGIWRLGATYRSKVDIDYEGAADFDQTPTGNAVFDAIVATTFPPDQGVATSVAFPAQASLGVAHMFGPSLVAEVNANWTQWSSFDRLDLEFLATPAANQSVPEDWDDVFNLRTGLEYRRDGTSPWTWRGGYYFDESPQPTEGVGPLLPDADRHGLTAGLGWQSGGGSTAIDAYALYIISPERSTEGINRDGYNGTYQGTSWAVGASLGLTFP